MIMMVGESVNDYNQSWLVMIYDGYVMIGSSCWMIISWLVKYNGQSMINI